MNDFDHLVRQFNQHWDKFLRAYLACPPEVGTERDCKPALGRIDYPEFQRAEKAARKLFDLKG